MWISYAVYLYNNSAAHPNRCTGFGFIVEKKEGATETGMDGEWLHDVTALGLWPTRYYMRSCYCIALPASQTTHSRLVTFVLVYRLTVWSLWLRARPVCTSGCSVAWRVMLSSGWSRPVRQIFTWTACGFASMPAGEPWRTHTCRSAVVIPVIVKQSGTRDLMSEM